VESVTGRSIVLNVEPEQNSKAGLSCLKWRAEYRRFLPGMIHWIISQKDWQKKFVSFIHERTQQHRKATSGISNGFRIAGNWALNSLGFDLFIKYLVHIDSINEKTAKDLEKECHGIVSEHLTKQALSLQSQRPTEVFFGLIQRKLATKSVRISRLPNGNDDRKATKVVGKVMSNETTLCIFPDTAMELISHHFRAAGQKCPFSKDALRDALVRENLIVRPTSGRLTTQVRLNGIRLQAWQFETAKFKELCCIEEDAEDKSKDS
jgi:hypothetical protein